MIPNPSTSPEWTTRTKRTVLIGVLIFLGVLLFLLRPMVPFVVVSMILAYLFNPVVTFFAERVLRIEPLNAESRRGCAILITYALAILVLIIGVLVIVPILVEQVTELGRTIPVWLNTLEQEAERVLSQPLTLNGEEILIQGEPFIPLDRLREALGTQSLVEGVPNTLFDVSALTRTLFSSISDLTGQAFEVFGGAFTTLLNITFLLLMTFYLLMDGRHFVEQGIDLITPDYQGDVRRLVTDLGRVWNAYLRGQLFLSLNMAFMVYVTMSILGVPNPPILALLAGMLELLPFVGPFIAMVVGALLALATPSATFPFLSGFGFMLVTVIAYSVLQNFQGFFVTPRVMGNRLNLHPFFVIVAILSGAALVGPVGIILAAPFLASGRIISIYIYGKLMGRSPFVETDWVRDARPAWFIRLAQRVIARVQQWLAQRRQAKAPKLANPSTDGG